MGGDCNFGYHLRMVGSARGAFCVARFLKSIEAARRALIPHDNESPLYKSNARRVNV